MSQSGELRRIFAEERNTKYQNMTRNETPYRKKGLSVFLTVLMVLSVVAMSAAFAGSVAADHEDEIEQSDGEDFVRLWDGQVTNISVDGDPVDLYEEQNGSGDFIEERSASNDNITFDTDNFEVGDYSILDDGDWINIEIREQTLNDSEFNVSQVEVNESASLTIDSQRSNFNTSVSSGDLDLEELNDIFGEDYTNNSTDHDHNSDFVILQNNDSTQDYNANFTNISEGTYEFDLEVIDSSAETTLTIEVVEEVEQIGEVEFGEITGAEAGDNATIELLFEDADDFESDEVQFWINESDYNAEIELNLSDGEDFDDDSLTIDWNTYWTGYTNHSGMNATDAFSVTSHDNASVQNVTETNISEGFRLNAGGYNLNLYADGGDFADRVDTDSVTISERDTGGASTYIAPDDIEDVIDDAEEGDEIDWMLGNATDSGTVAQGDYIIIEQEVNGIFGYAFDADGSLNASANISVDVTPAESPSYQEPESMNASDFDGLLSDAEEGVLYFYTQVDDSDELEEGDVEEWEYEFTIDDGNDYVDDDEDETAEAGYEVVPRTVDLDLVEEPYQVTPTEDAVITGTTSLAPGSTVEIEAVNPGIFSDTEDVDVEEVDGERVWTYTADYSDREVDEEFEITVDDDTYDAIFADDPESDTVSENDQLQDQIDDLEDQLADAESENSDLQDAIDAAESENEELQNSLDGANEDVEELEGQVEDLQSDLDDAESFQDNVLSILDNFDIEDLDELEEELDSDDGTPGFGPIAALFALLAGGALVARRRLN